MVACISVEDPQCLGGEGGTTTGKKRTHQLLTAGVSDAKQQASKLLVARGQTEQATSNMDLEFWSPFFLVRCTISLQDMFDVHCTSLH